jgi:hypothetical protein
MNGALGFWKICWGPPVNLFAKLTPVLVFHRDDENLFDFLRRA